MSLIPRVVLIKLVSIQFMATRGRPTGKARFKLDFLGPNYHLLAQFPALGFMETPYGEVFAPAGGLFQRIVPVNDVGGGVFVHVIAHDENNPPGTNVVYSTDPHEPEGQRPKPHEVVLQNDPMECIWSPNSPFHAPNNLYPATSTTQVGQSFDERFCLQFMTWADPPIRVGGELLATG